jgi:single stranded DNA-binding protein
MSFMQFAHATIRGNLAEAPVIRRTSSGEAVTNLRVITNRSIWDRASGQYRDVPLGHYVVVFGEDAERAAQAQTGDHIMVAGEISQSSYTAADGSRRYKTEILVTRASGCISISPRKRNAGESPDDLIDQAPEA